MTGPIDESRHAVTYTGDGEVRHYVPKPWHLMTTIERHDAEDVDAVRRWMAARFAAELRPRRARRNR